MALLRDRRPALPEPGKLDRTPGQRPADPRPVPRELRAGRPGRQDRSRPGELLAEVRRPEQADLRPHRHADALVGRPEDGEATLQGTRSAACQGKANADVATRPRTKPKIRDIPIIIVDCNRTPKPNVAVQGVDVEAAVPVAGLPVKATVDAAEHCPPFAQQRRVELLIDGVKEASSPELKHRRRKAELSYDFAFTFQARRAAPRRGPPGGRRRLEVRRPPLLHHGGRPGHSRGHRQGRSGTKFPISTTRSTWNRPCARPGAAAGPSRPRRWSPPTWSSEPLGKYKVIFCVNLPAPDARRGRAAAELRRGAAATWSGSAATTSSRKPTTR